MNNDDFFFDENGNLNAGFNQEASEFEAKFNDETTIAKEPEPAAAMKAEVAISASVLDSELEANHRQLVERIQKIQDLVDNKDSYGFNEATVSAFEDQLTQLNKSLKDIDEVFAHQEETAKAEEKVKQQQAQNERLRQEEIREQEEEHDEAGLQNEQKPLEAMSLSELKEYKDKMTASINDHIADLQNDMKGMSSDIYNMSIENSKEDLLRFENSIEEELKRRKELEKAFSSERNNVNEEENISVKNTTSTFTERLAFKKKQLADEAELKKKEEDSRPWYKKLGSVSDYFSDGFKAKSHARASFLDEYQIHDMFGDQIDKIVNRSDSRLVHFKDKTSIIEKGQEIIAKGESYNSISEKVSKMAIAKGWKSIQFEGSDVFLQIAYEKSTRMGLVVEPKNEEQEELFKRIHKLKKLDEIMPFSGMKHEEIDKEIEVPEIKAHRGSHRMRM